MAFCPEQPNGPRPNAPLPIPTPCQRVGIVTRDAGTGVQRTLSPTAYRPEQTSGITSLWAPQGLGMIRDGNSQFRRIYWECEDSGHRLLRVEGSPSASFGWNPWCIFFSEFLATCAVERIVGNWYSNLWPARGSLYSACIRCRHFRSLCSAEKERGKADLERGREVALVQPRRSSHHGVELYPGRINSW